MKEDFKNFVNNHKELIKYVNSDKMTWQKFYDMYSLYEKNSDVWYKLLNIYPKLINKMNEDMKKTYKLTIEDKVSDLISKINLIKGFIDASK